MQRALTVKRKHGEGMNAVFRVENRVYREFQMDVAPPGCPSNTKTPLLSEPL